MSDEQNVPKWGDDRETIPEWRRNQLLKLYEEQVRWLSETEPDRDNRQSPFAQAPDGPGAVRRNLAGGEVYFLQKSLHGRHLLHLEGAYLSFARLEGANLIGAHLEGAILLGAHLEGANLFGAHLEGCNLSEADLKGANLMGAYLVGALLTEAHLESAILSYAVQEHTSRSIMLGALVDLLSGSESADLSGNPSLPTHLEGANLRSAFFSTASDLSGAVVFDEKHGMVSVADVRWQNVNLAVVKAWPEKPVLGDERTAREWEQKPLTKDRLSADPILYGGHEALPTNATREERRKSEADRHEDILTAWRTAARAYRQLASTMRDQGMNDEADRFAYRGNVCQRQLYRVQGKHLRRFGFWLLDLVSGYGYRPLRSVAAYVLIIAFFTGLYLLNAQFAAPHLTWDEALVLSISSFHGRRFFSSEIALGNNLARIAAGEAIIGLLLEITFIATFTQRFFAR